MILAYSAVFTTVFALLLYQEQQLIIIALTLFMSIIFYIHQCIIAKTHGIIKIIKGDFPYQLAFALWLYVFKASHFIYFIPLLLGIVGRIYVMAVFGRSDVTTISQQLIIFQNQCQAFTLFTLVLQLISFSQWKLMQFLCFALLVKLKYRFYFPARKAYNQMHFFFDRLSRHLNLRSLYHIIYECVSIFSNDVRSPMVALDIFY